VGIGNKNICGKIMKIMNEKRIEEWKNEERCKIKDEVNWKWFVMWKDKRICILVGKVIKCECWKYEGIMCKKW
jgi:hypothetical protein